jgi:hypothetical protein
LAYCDVVETVKKPGDWNSIEVDWEAAEDGTIISISGSSTVPAVAGQQRAVPSFFGRRDSISAIAL